MSTCGSIITKDASVYPPTPAMIPDVKDDKISLDVEGFFCLFVFKK